MNKVILILTYVFSFSSAFAATNLSGLKKKTSHPTIANIKSDFKDLKKILTKSNLSNLQKDAITEFEKSLEAEVLLPTLKRQKSRGPAWRQSAIDQIERNYDIHETISYTDEDGDASKYCGFEPSNLDDIFEYYFTWESVKKVHGTQKSVAYILKLIVPLIGKSHPVGEFKKCNYIREEFAFEAKLVNGQPVQIKF